MEQYFEYNAWTIVALAALIVMATACLGIHTMRQRVSGAWAKYDEITGALSGKLNERYAEIMKLKEQIRIQTLNLRSVLEERDSALKRINDLAATNLGLENRCQSYQADMATQNARIAELEADCAKHREDRDNQSNRVLELNSLNAELRGAAGEPKRKYKLDASVVALRSADLLARITKYELYLTFTPETGAPAAVVVRSLVASNKSKDELDKIALQINSTVERFVNL